MSAPFPTTPTPAGRQRAAMDLAATSLWHVPGSFGVARILGPRYSLRSVLFHDVSDTESSFTKGLGGTITCKNFENALRFLTLYYTPVSLQDVLASFEGRRLPRRPVLVTFDDAYASVREIAAPLCKRFGVPAVFFVNASCLDNQQLALDNLICYVANLLGLDTMNDVIHTVAGWENFRLHSLADVFRSFLPFISLAARSGFRDTLVRAARISEPDSAAEAGLYISSEQLRDLASFNFEIGNHTYTHVHGRPLSTADFAQEIDTNKATLELVSGARVRSFSVPYGSSADLTPELLSHLQRSGYEAVFLAEGRTNSRDTDRALLNRISIRTGTNATLFSEIEVLPRLRTIRNGIITASNSQAHWHNSSLTKATQTSPSIFAAPTVKKSQ